VVGKREKKSKRKSFIGSHLLKIEEKEEISSFFFFFSFFLTNQLRQFLLLSCDMSESGMARIRDDEIREEKEIYCQYTA